MRRSASFLAGLLLFATLWSCQQTQPVDTLPSAIFIPRNIEAPEAPTVEETVFAEAYEQAVDCRRRSEIERALRIIEEALALGASPDWHGRLVRLEGELRRESVQRTILDAFVLVRQKRFVLGETIEGEIILQNISGSTILIPATRSTSIVGQAANTKAQSILHATVVFTEYKPMDMVIRNSQDRMIIIDKDIVLKPGAVFRQPIAIDSSAMNPQSPTYRTYEFGGTVHPTIIGVGEKTFTSRIELRSATAHVFPRNFEHLADAPLEKLKDALNRSATLHLPIAAALLARDDHSAALRALFSELNRVGCEDPLRQAIITCLRIITGATLGGSLIEWNAWYRNQTEKRSS